MAILYFYSFFYKCFNFSVSQSFLWLHAKLVIISGLFVCLLYAHYLVANEGWNSTCLSVLIMYGHLWIPQRIRVHPWLHHIVMTVWSITAHVFVLQLELSVFCFGQAGFSIRQIWYLGHINVSFIWILPRILLIIINQWLFRTSIIAFRIAHLRFAISFNFKRIKACAPSIIWIQSILAIAVYGRWHLINC